MLKLILFYIAPFLGFAEPGLYRENLKNWFFTALGFPYHLYFHSSLFVQKWPPAPNTNDKDASCQILDSSGCFGVTYGFSGGRFGDNLLSYLHAKWISYERGLPLLYKSFPYSSYLVMDEKEVKFDLNAFPDQGEQIVYDCPYFPEDLWEQKQFSFQTWNVNWQDPMFRKQALSMIAPKQPLKTIVPPKNRISIALHYREGGGFDRTTETWPLKFPPLSFYLDGLQKVVELTQHKPLYCFLFTDARHPLFILEALKTAFPDIQFDARRGKNRHYLNVLEDFFSFFYFDAIIRPQSNFSMVPSLLHDFPICHFPSFAEKTNGSYVITQTRTDVKEALLEKILLWYDH